MGSTPHFGRASGPKSSSGLVPEQADPVSETNDTDTHDDDERTVVVFHGSRLMYLVTTAIGIATWIAMIVIVIAHLL